MFYSREQLQRCEGARVPDLVGDDCRLLFVGINPGLWTAATGLHFAHPSNRFYPALLEAGIIQREVDVKPPHPSVPLAGLFEGPIDVALRSREADRLHMIERGLAITNLVRRATARASELAPDELQAGRDRLEAFVDRHDPRVVAVAGITAYRTAFGRRRAAAGRQSESIGDASLWVVPNPSGLNAHETVATLAKAYRAPAVEAGVVDG